MQQGKPGLQVQPWFRIWGLGCLSDSDGCAGAGSTQARTLTGRRSFCCLALRTHELACCRMCGSFAVRDEFLLKLRSTAP